MYFNSGIGIVEIKKEFADFFQITCFRKSKNRTVEKILAKLASLAKWLSVHLQNKWFCIRTPLLSLKL